MPDPNPSSWGRSSQPIPVYNTNKIPCRHKRSGTGRGPGDRAGHGGNNGSIRPHNSSSTTHGAATQTQRHQHPTGHGQPHPHKIVLGAHSYSDTSEPSTAVMKPACPLPGRPVNAFPSAQSVVPSGGTIEHARKFSSAPESAYSPSSPHGKNVRNTKHLIPSLPLTLSKSGSRKSSPTWHRVNFDSHAMGCACARKRFNETTLRTAEEKHFNTASSRDIIDFRHHLYQRE